ncbi:aminotransferase class I/II-fold pyridoxal phosphate-dependent enzyme [Maribacter sp. MJ134]|uniref:pyridoxal phosphate-dependent aminotransferase n=1 Tax=Maribacter sp. MJ134 TaxID=2496865 RepID=UPI000F82FC6C|nr:histidinol-phosphate transaminase [Maribacter sp. MJ134]AZQ60375.1 aminotransferase class I/II-fold pyridoxal phosphate-dependent enzyme [Maribacter sp. MJ134]
MYKSYIQEDSTYKGGGKKLVMPEGIEVHKLSSNENPLGFSQKVSLAISNALNDLSLYPDNTDIRLREALSKDFEGKLAPDHFVTANSGSEIIDIISKVFLSEGDEVIVSQPCFLPYTAFTRWMGAKAINVPMTPDYDYNLEGILKVITERTKLVFLASPNNPSGNHIPRHVLADFLSRLPKEIIVVYDEVYRHFAVASDYTSALPFVLEGHPIIAINSFSKTYGLAGLRVGYCYAPLELSNYIRKVCKPFLLSSLALEGAIAALEDVDFVQRTVELVRVERQFVLEGLRELGIKFWPTEGNFVMIDPPIADMEFTKFMEERGIMVRPVGVFGAPGKVRISFGVRKANEAMLAVLKELLNNR